VSDEAPEQSSKTEDPSQKKLEDAHKRGDVVKSQEVTTWFMLSGSALVFAMMAAPTSAGLSNSLKNLLANADQFEVGGAGFGAFFYQLAGSILLVALIPSLIARPGRKLPIEMILTGYFSACLTVWSLLWLSTRITS